MASYPDEIFSPRAKENKPGVVYDPDKKTVLFAEDVSKLDSEVVAIETELMGNKSAARYSQVAVAQIIPSDLWIRLILDHKGYDEKDEFDNTTKTGTADGTIANHLQDDTNHQFTTDDVGRKVWNKTDNTYAKITAFNDSGDVTLDADIFVSGEDYEIYDSVFTAEEAGLYYVRAQAYFMHTNMVADKRLRIEIQKNNIRFVEASVQVAYAERKSVATADIVKLNAGDKLDVITMHDVGADLTLWNDIVGTYFVVKKI